MNTATPTIAMTLLSRSLRPNITSPMKPKKSGA